MHTYTYIMYIYIYMYIHMFCWYLMVPCLNRVGMGCLAFCTLLWLEVDSPNRVDFANKTWCRRFADPLTQFPILVSRGAPPTKYSNCIWWGEVSQNWWGESHCARKTWCRPEDRDSKLVPWHRYRDGTHKPAPPELPVTVTVPMCGLYIYVYMYYICMYIYINTHMWHSQYPEFISPASWTHHTHVLAGCSHNCTHKHTKSHSHADAQTLA